MMFLPFKMHTRGMIRVLLSLVLAASPALSLAQQDAARQAATPSQEPPPPPYQPPEAPPEGILDSASLFTGDRREKLAAMIERSRQTHRFGFYLATYESLNPRELPADRARLLASAWLDDESPGAVLVYVDDEERFAMRITPELALLDREKTLDPLPRQYERLADRRTSTAAAVREAATDFDYRIRTLIDGRSKRSRTLQPLLYAGAAALALLGLLVVAVVVREVALQNFFGRKLLFPECRKPERLGGRNSGGHGVSITYDQHQRAGGKKTKATPGGAHAAETSQNEPAAGPENLPAPTP